MRCGAFHRVEGTLCLVRHGQAALSGSKTKAPGFAGGYLHPFTGNFELASPGSVPKFNSFQGKWQMAPRNSVPRFNQYSEKWEMAPPDARLQINPYTGEWHYPR